MPPRNGFRFSLSTLLLVCAFAGALIGCFMQRHAWRRRMDFPSLGPNKGNPRNGYLAFNSRGDQLAVYEAGGRTSLFDLNSRKRAWNTREMVCFYTSLRFEEPENALWIVDHMRAREPGILSRRLRLEDGTNNLTSPQVELNDADLEMSLRDVNPYVFGTKFILSSQSPDGKEVAVPDSELPICRILFAPEGHFDLPIGTPAVAARYSSDSNQLAILHSDGAVSVWRRERAYDSSGWLTLPVFWIAVALGLALLVRLGMRIFRRGAIVQRIDSKLLCPP